MRNHLNRLLVAAVFYLPALGLAGCNVSSKAGLGISSTSPQAAEERSTADRAVDMAGGIGAFTAGIGGGMIGGGTGAVGGGLYAVYNGTPIASGIADGAASGAHFVSSIASPVGKYAFGMAARGIIWVAPYAFNGLGWLASNTYGGIKYVSSAIYNGIGSSQSLADGSALNQDSGWGNTYDKDDKHEQGTELTDFSKTRPKLETCPFGFPISGISKILTQ